MNYMLTLVGRDRPGIVADVSRVLYEAGCQLGEASMMRLAGNFSIMLVLDCARSRGELEALLAPVAEALGLRLHLDEVQAEQHDHPLPDARISVHGADRPGIVAEVTRALAEAGFNILDLETAVGGSEEAPIYIMIIEGQATLGMEPLARAVERLRGNDIELSLEPVETLVG